jgi:hypothetical protein
LRKRVRPAFDSAELERLLGGSMVIIGEGADQNIDRGFESALCR